MLTESGQFYHCYSVVGSSKTDRNYVSFSLQMPGLPGSPGPRQSVWWVAGNPRDPKNVEDQETLGSQ